MDTILSLIKMFFFLGIILYLISLSMKFLNRYTTQQQSELQVLQKITVTKTSAIGIVKIVDTFYVMSFSEQRNEVIRELSEEEAAKLLAKPTPTTPELTKDMLKWTTTLQEKMKRGTKKP